MEIKDLTCIILAGGLGTRIRPVIGDTPKFLAPINGRAYADYCLEYLNKQGINKIIMALTPKHKNFINFHLRTYWNTFHIVSDYTEGCLGVNCSIHSAAFRGELDSIWRMKYPVIVINGDTLLTIDLRIPLKAFLLSKVEALEVHGLSYRTGKYTSCGIRLYSKNGIKNIETIHPMVIMDSSPYLDIGVPESYAKAPEFVEKYYDSTNF